MVNSKEASFAYLETLSDEQLCAACQLGNRNAEEVLAARYHRLVRSIARPYFLAGGDNEDLLQEGMVGLIKAMRNTTPIRPRPSAPLPRYVSGGGCIRCSNPLPQASISLSIKRSP